MRRVAIINQKGGVGKTTTTVNLGAALARTGSRVLLVDLDPQGHLGLHLGVDVPEGEATIYDVLTDEMPLRKAIVNVSERLDIVPSNIDLAAAESELVSVLGREVLLRDALEPVEEDYDYMLIDCPPSLGVLTINALVAASELLIPLQAQFFALQGFSKLLDKTVRLVRQRINPQLEVLGVILCMHEKQTRLSGEVVADIRSFLEASRGQPVAWAKAKVFDTCVRRNVKLAEATSFGQSVLDYDPKSNGALDYQDLAVEIFSEVASPEPVEEVEPDVVLAPVPAPPRAVPMNSVAVKPTALEVVKPRKEKVVKPRSAPAASNGTVAAGTTMVPRKQKSAARSKPSTTVAKKKAPVKRKAPVKSAVVAKPDPVSSPAPPVEATVVASPEASAATPA